MASVDIQWLRDGLKEQREELKEQGKLLAGVVSTIDALSKRVDDYRDQCRGEHGAIMMRLDTMTSVADTETASTEATSVLVGMNGWQKLAVWTSGMTALTFIVVALINGFLGETTDPTTIPVMHQAPAPVVEEEPVPTAEEIQARKEAARAAVIELLQDLPGPDAL